MTPFDLKRALAGEPVVKRNGVLVRRVIGTFPEMRSDHQLLVIDNDGYLREYSDDGRYYRDASDCHLDLFMAKPARDRVEDALVAALESVTEWFDFREVAVGPAEEQLLSQVKAAIALAKEGE